MIYIVVIVVCILLVYSGLVYFKKRAAKEALSGVDVIKAALYATLKERLLTKHQKGTCDDAAINDEKYCGELAAAAVNEIFGDHTEKSLQVFSENTALVVNEIKDLGRTHPELKRITTDSIRISIQARFMLSRKVPENTKQIFDNAMERGIFIKGGKAPDIKSFLRMVEGRNTDPHPGNLEEQKGR